jgi:hypothetical protein
MGPTPQSINVQPRFDNLMDYPGYDFYLAYVVGYPSGNLHLTRVESGIPISLQGPGRGLSANLLAVPSGQVLPPPPAESFRNIPPGEADMDSWSGKLPPGTLRSERLWEIKPEYTYHPSIQPYQVHIEGDRLQVTALTPIHWAIYISLAVGVGLCLTFTALGLWLGRMMGVRSRAP